MKLKACPFCGFNYLDSDDNDVVHLVTRSGIYGVHCVESAGGCSASVLGYNAEEAIANWQHRSPNIDESIIDWERRCHELSGQVDLLLNKGAASL